VEGQITGFGFHLGVIDEGRAEAQSRTTRERTWNWFTDDFMSRLDHNSGVLMIMTRWHVDHPVGRFIDRYPEARILRYPAIAENNDDLPYRRSGEALFEEHQPLKFLLEQRKLMTLASWESEYQQNPIVVGGGIFPRAGHGPFRLVACRFFRTFDQATASVCMTCGWLPLEFRDVGKQVGRLEVRRLRRLTNVLPGPQT